MSQLGCTSLFFEPDPKHCAIRPVRWARPKLTTLDVSANNRRLCSTDTQIKDVMCGTHQYFNCFDFLKLLSKSMPCFILVSCPVAILINHGLNSKLVGEKKDTSNVVHIHTPKKLFLPFP